MANQRLHLVAAKTQRQFHLHREAIDAAAKADKPPPAARAWDFGGFSGRGVELRVLDLAEKELALELGAKGLGEDATLAELRARQMRECVARMVVAATKEASLDEAGLARATWVRVSQLELDGKLSAWFTAKDMDVLIAAYRRRHDATQEDLEAIEGKAIELAADG